MTNSNIKVLHTLVFVERSVMILAFIFRLVQGKAVFNSLHLSHIEDSHQAKKLHPPIPWRETNYRLTEGSENNILTILPFT